MSFANFVLLCWFLLAQRESYACYVDQDAKLLQPKYAQSVIQNPAPLFVTSSLNFNIVMI